MNSAKTIDLAQSLDYEKEEPGIPSLQCIYFIIQSKYIL